MEGNRILYVCGCTENGGKENIVGLTMYSEWKEMEFCLLADVQVMERNRIV
jgi:hypothetical protein